MINITDKYNINEWYKKKIIIIVNDIKCDLQVKV